MKKTTFSLQLSSLSLIFGSIVLFLPGCTTIHYLETFSNQPIGTDYRWFDEDTPDSYNLTTNPGWLRIEAATRQDYWPPSKTGAPLLLRKAPKYKYSVETFVSADPLSAPSQPVNTQMGLFLFKDSKNWLFYGLTHHDFTLDDGRHFGNGLMVTTSQDGNFIPLPIDGASDPRYPVKPLGNDSVYIKIIRKSEHLNFYWKSTHGEDWSLLVSTEFDLGDHEAGVGIKTFDISPSGVEMPGQVNFDYFLIKNI